VVRGRVISQLYRACAAGQPGLFSKVGSKPRLGGGKVNNATRDDIVKLVEVEDDEWLFTRRPRSVALSRGTSADPAGNISMEREALLLNGVIVIAQVERSRARRPRSRRGRPAF
jgi:propionate CoA-transferase